MKSCICNKDIPVGYGNFKKGHQYLYEDATEGYTIIYLNSKKIEYDTMVFNIFFTDISLKREFNLNQILLS